MQEHNPSLFHRFVRRVILSGVLAALVAPVSTSAAATLNPSASKAYVDKKVAEIYGVIKGKSVFTNTLQVVVNIYTNTYTDVTFKTNVTVNVESVTTNYYFNTYTNTYQTNVYTAVYNVTTNTYHREYTTNYNYNVTYKTNVTLNIDYTTNINTKVYNTYTNTYQTNINTEVYNITTNTYQTNFNYTVTTNVNEYITNVVNIVTNNPVFPDPVSYTNSAQSIFGYTGLVITVSEWLEPDSIPAAYATNAVVFAPRTDMANTYTNATHTISLMYGISPMTSKNDFWYAAYSNSVTQANPTPMASSSEYDDPSLNLNLRTSYQGSSWAEASSMTLLYTTQMMTDYALILQRAQVASKEVNSRVVEYNETIAAGYSDEARRLVSDGGLQWLDPTGIWWEVSSVYPVKAYRVLGQTLYQVPTDEQVVANQDAKFANTNETISMRHGLTSDGSMYYSTWNLMSHDPYISITVEEYSYDYDYELDPVVIFTDNQSLYVAYACTAYTNGVVKTNAVRRTVFHDEIPSLGALTSFDDKSVSTNQFGELEIKGFSSADHERFPNKNGGIEWKSAEEVYRLAMYGLGTKATWGEYNGYLYNCYVQVGRTVYAVGSGNQSKIEIINRQVGAYGVGVSYNGTGYNVTFDLISSLSASASYDAVVYVGTIFTESGQRKWSGVGSIPLVLVFE